MKFIKIIFSSLILLLSYFSNASSSNDILVQKMSEDETVVSFINKTNALIFIEALGVDYSNFDQTTKEQMKTIYSSIDTDISDINNRFPEFASMKKNERKEVLSKVVKNSSKVKKFFKCFGVTFGGTFAGCSGLLLTKWMWARFWTCAGIAAAADVTIIVASDGLAVEAVISEAGNELEACMELALNGEVNNAAWCVIPAFTAILTTCLVL